MEKTSTSPSNNCVKNNTASTDKEVQSIINRDKIDFELSTESMDTLIEKHQDHYNSVNDFSFNIFEFSQSVGRNMQMPILATSLLKQNDLLSHVDYHKFLKFFA